MPYIKKEVRPGLYPLTERPAEDEGELNYQVTELIVQYLERHGLSYARCGDIVGALDNAKDEFRRRVQHGYEDLKIITNGDVYPQWMLHHD